MFRNLPYNISVLRPCFHEQMHWGVFRLEVGEFRLGYIFFQIAALRLITSLYYSTIVWIFFWISVVKVNRFCEVTLTSDHQNQFILELKWMFLPNLKDFLKDVSEILHSWQSKQDKCSSYSQSVSYETKEIYSWINRAENINNDPLLVIIYSEVSLSGWQPSSVYIAF